MWTTLADVVCPILDPYEAEEVVETGHRLEKDNPIVPTARGLYDYMVLVLRKSAIPEEKKKRILEQLQEAYNKTPKGLRIPSLSEEHEIVQPRQGNMS